MILENPNIDLFPDIFWLGDPELTSGSFLVGSGGGVAGSGGGVTAAAVWGSGGTVIAPPQVGQVALVPASSSGASIRCPQ